MKIGWVGCLFLQGGLQDCAVLVGFWSFFAVGTCHCFKKPSDGERGNSLECCQLPVWMVSVAVI